MFSKHIVRHFSLQKSSNNKFNLKDAFDIKSLLTSEEKILQESVKAFCNQYLKTKILNDFRNEHHDATIFRQFGEQGILGCSFQGYGCAGVSHVGAGLVAREIERVDSGYRSMFSVQSSLVMGAIYMFGSEEQKRKYLPQLAQGKLIGCFGLTEPNAGSDVANMSTKAHYDSSNQQYIMNGSKTWISNAPIADICILWAKCDDSVKGFILEKDLDGYNTNVIEGKFGLRASVTGTISLNNVKVGKDQVLPLANGYKAPFKCLNSARYGISWGVLGAAQ